MKKNYLQLSFKQFVTSVIPYAVIAMYVSSSFAFLVTSLITKQVNGDMENLAKIFEYEVRQRLEPPAYAANALADSIGNDTGGAERADCPAGWRTGVGQYGSWTGIHLVFL